MHGECALEDAGVPYQKTPRLVRLEEPLVGVQTDRVGPRDPLQETLVLFGNCRKTATLGDFAFIVSSPLFLDDRLMP